MKNFNFELGELLGHPLKKDNQQPSWVQPQTVQRLSEEDTSFLITDKSAQLLTVLSIEDIVRSA